MTMQRFDVTGGEVIISTPEIPGVDPTKDPEPCTVCGAKLRFLEELPHGMCNGCGPGSERWYETHPDERPAQTIQGPPETLPEDLRAAIEKATEQDRPKAEIMEASAEAEVEAAPQRMTLDGTPIEEPKIDAADATAPIATLTEVAKPKKARK